MVEESEESKLFKALASPIRLHILKNLNKQSLSYTELMRAVGMVKRSGSGKFAHHMYILISSGLVRLDEKTKAYELTPQGMELVKSLETLHTALFSSDRLKVRKSGLFIEKFDRNKIAQVLVDEANMPPKTADKLARLAEEKLEGLKIGYLTAPLIRELVNALLIDQGLEEYRHRLSRLGMPVYDVEKLLNQASENHDFQLLVKQSSNSIFREYVLQSALPREAVDAYLSGDIDLDGVDTWAFSISAKLYTSEPDKIINALSEVDGIENEVVLKFSESTDIQLLSFFLKYLRSKNIKATIYSEEFIETKLDVNFQLVVPLEKLSLKNQKTIDVILSQKPASSEGYTFSTSGMIDGKASINLVGLYLKSKLVEKIFWDSLSSTMEKVFDAFEKKKEKASRFWDDLQGFFILSFVGTQQISKHTGISEFSLIEKLWSECKEVSTDEVMLVPSGQSSEKAAGRLKQLDIIRFGAKPIYQIAGAGQYSWDISFQNIDRVLQVSKYLPGGLKTSIHPSQADKLHTLKPLVVLSSGPQA